MIFFEWVSLKVSEARGKEKGIGRTSVRDTVVTNGNKPHHVYFVLVEERTNFF
jgi:hypothetical protein